MRSKEEQAQVHAEYQASRLNRCKHFNGTINKICKAGVSYDQVKIPTNKSEGMRFLFPCVDGPVVPCSLAEYPTQDELAKEDAEFKIHLEKMFKVRAAIVEFTKGKRGQQGRIDCPACGTGKVSFSVASNNGHIHARCTTEKCVNWME